ncbi:hypothetical protein CAEBREN_17713 [Caenorhabditis brenneri]|uniref:C2H2-type domain-containing protein n=1 Tax=Caenorhabditis brenneri TaxID=135651 RepID=G0MBY1_CAEBE|nr:hypothetical protein CAEBREN_17713 [Caenorhabditis brenneri]
MIARGIDRNLRMKDRCEMEDSLKLGCYTMRCYKCNTSFVSMEVYKEHKDWCHPTPSDVEAYQTPDKLHAIHENCHRHFVVPATKKEIADGRGVVQWHLYQNGHQQIQELHDFQKAHPNQVNSSGYQGYNNPYGASNGPHPRNSASGASYNPYQHQRNWNPRNYNGGWNRGGWNHRGRNRGGRGGVSFHSRGASWRPLVSNQDGEKENDQNREQPSTPTRPARPPTPFTSPGELAPLQIVSPPDTPTQASETGGFPLVEDPQEMPQSPVDEVEVEETAPKNLAPQSAEPFLPSPTATEPVDAIPLPSEVQAATPTADSEAQSEELSAPAEQHQDVAMIAQALPTSEIPLPPSVVKLAPLPSPMEADLGVQPEELHKQHHQDVALIEPQSSDASLPLSLEVIPPQSPPAAEPAGQDALSAHETSSPQPVAEVVLPSPTGSAAGLAAVQLEEQPVPTEQEAPRAPETPLSSLAPPPSPLPASLTVQTEQDALFVPPSPSPAASLAVLPEEQSAPDEPVVQMIAQAPLPPQAGNVPVPQPRDQSDEDDVIFVCEVKKGKAPRPSPAANLAVRPEEQQAPDEQAVQVIAQTPPPPQAGNVPEPQPRDQSEDDDVIFLCEVKKNNAPRPPLPPPPPAPKIHSPHVVIDLGPLPELPAPPMPLPMPSPNENLPSPTAKNGPPAWLRCNKWSDLKEKLSPELEAQLTPDQRRGYIGSLWTEHPEPAQSPPGLHDGSQLGHSPEISEAPAPSHPVQQKSSGSYPDYQHCDFIGQVRIEIDADGKVQVLGEFSQDESQGRQESGEQGHHGAQTPKRYEDPDRQLTPTPDRRSSQNTHTPSYRDTLGSPVLSSPEGSPPAPVSSKPRGSKSVSFSEPLVQCCYLLLKSQEVEYRQFIAKKTEKRVSTSSIPSVPPPVKKVATVPPAKIPAKAPVKAPVPNGNIFDSILDVMSSPQGPTILGVERKELAPAKVKGPNFMAKKGFTFGKK